MSFLRSLFNIILGMFGGVLGNLLAAWILQDAWGNTFSPMRLLATVAGFALVILALAWLDARAQSQPASPPASSPAGQVSGNIQIGRSVIRVFQGANVMHNLQIGANTIEVQSIGGQGAPDRYTSQQLSDLRTHYQDLTRQLAEVDAELAQPHAPAQSLTATRSDLVRRQQETLATLQSLESRHNP